jgi:hypothetical protein
MTQKVRISNSISDRLKKNRRISHDSKHIMNGIPPTSSSTSISANKESMDKEMIKIIRKLKTDTLPSHSILKKVYNLATSCKSACHELYYFLSQKEFRHLYKWMTALTNPEKSGVSS